MFTADRNGGIYVVTGTPDQGWGQWKSVLQGNAGPSVSVTAVPYGQRLAVFTADRNDGIYVVTGTPDQGWGPWGSVSEGNAGTGVSVTAVPLTAVPYGEDLAVFTADRDGGIYVTSGTPDQGWGPWGSVSEGNAGTGVSVAAVPYGQRLAVFTADRNGGVYPTGGAPPAPPRPWDVVASADGLDDNGFLHSPVWRWATGVGGVIARPL